MSLTSYQTAPSRASPGPLHRPGKKSLQCQNDSFLTKIPGATALSLTHHAKAPAQHQFAPNGGLSEHDQKARANDHGKPDPGCGVRQRRKNTHPHNTAHGIAVYSNGVTVLASAMR